MFLSSMPSITVVGLPNFRVSSLTRILCCSFSISPQTHKSFGSPHVEQTSAMTLNSELASGIYKSFKKKFVATSWLVKVATFRVAFCVLGCFFGLGFGSFCGLRLLFCRLRLLGWAQNGETALDLGFGMVFIPI